MRVTKNALALTLSVFVLVFCFAGISNLDSLKLKPAVGDTNVLEVENVSGEDALVVVSATSAVNLGAAASTVASKLSVFDGGSDNKPGAVALYADNGSPVWLFVSTAGALRYHTAYPTDDDTNGSLVGSTDLSVDFDLTAVGGSTADPDFSVAGYAKLAGALEVDGAAAFDGAVTLGDAATDVITVNSDDFQFTAAAKVTLPATAYFTQMRIGTGSATGHTADAADCIFVEGIAEIDGAFFADAAATVAGTATFNGPIATPDDGELTVSAGGVITVTGSFHTVDTAADGATDDVDTITAGTDGQIVVLMPEHTDRSIVITEAGNILCGGAKTLDDSEDTITLLYSTALTKWVVIALHAN